MATHINTMAFGAIEAPAGTYAQAFAGFLPVFAAFIEAEADLDQVDGFDPAYGLWQRDAEKAQDRMMDALRPLRLERPSSKAEAPLRRMVILINQMLAAGDAEQFRDLHRHLHVSFFRNFQTVGGTPLEQAVNFLVVHARVLIDRMVGLSLFDREPASPDPLDSELMPDF